MDWCRLKEDRESRLKQGDAYRIEKKLVAAKDTGRLLEAVIRPGDRVCLEGNNQKQADFLAENFAA